MNTIELIKQMQDVCDQIARLSNDGKPRSSLELIEETLKKNPSSSLLYLKSIFLKRVDRAYESEEALKLAIQFTPYDAFTWFEKSIVFSRIGNNEQAYICTKQSLSFDPNIFDIAFQHGIHCEIIGRYEEALEQFYKATELRPNESDCWNKTADTLYALNRNAEAINAYNKAIELNPNHATAHYNRGNLFFESGKRKKALHDYIKTTQIDPQTHPAWHNKGVTLASLCRYKEALESFEMAIKIHPYSVNSLSEKGWTLACLDETEKAVQNIDYALLLDPNHGSSCFYKSALTDDAVLRLRYCRRAALLNTWINPKTHDLFISELWEKTPHPFLISQIAQMYPVNIYLGRWATALHTVYNNHSTELYIIKILSSYQTEQLTEIEISALGLLQHRLGDISGAQKSFERLDIDFESNLLGQYYLWDFYESISENNEALETILKESINHAQALDTNHQCDPEQRCYAGLIFAAAERPIDAAQAWNTNQGHLRSAYHLLALHHSQGDFEKRNALITSILEMEEERAKAGLKVYINGQPSLDDLDIQDPKWKEILLFCLQYYEIVDAARILHETWKANPAYPEWAKYSTGPLAGMKYGPADLTIVRGLSRSTQKHYNNYIRDQLNANVNKITTDTIANVDRLDVFLNAGADLERLVSSHLEIHKDKDRKFLLLAYLAISKRTTPIQTMIFVHWDAYVSGHSTNQKKLIKYLSGVTGAGAAAALGYILGTTEWSIPSAMAGTGLGFFLENALNDIIKIPPKLDYKSFKAKMIDALRKQGWQH